MSRCGSFRFGRFGSFFILITLGCHRFTVFRSQFLGHSFLVIDFGSQFLGYRFWVTVFRSQCLGHSVWVTVFGSQCLGHSF